MCDDFTVKAKRTSPVSACKRHKPSLLSRCSLSRPHKDKSINQSITMGNTSSSDTSNMTAEEAILAAMQQFNESASEHSISDSNKTENSRRSTKTDDNNRIRQRSSQKPKKKNESIEEVIRTLPDMDPQDILRLLEKHCGGVQRQSALGETLFEAVQGHPQFEDDESLASLGLSVPQVIFAIREGRS